MPFIYTNWYLMLPVAVCLHVVLQVHLGKSALRIVGPWVLCVRILIGTMIAFVVLAVAAQPSFLTLFVILLSGFGGLLLWVHHRLSRRGAVLLGAQSCQNDAQRRTFFTGIARENFGSLRRRARVALKEMGRGTTWDKALEQSRIARSFGERLGVRLKAYTDGKSPLSQPTVERSRFPERHPIEQDLEPWLMRLMAYFWLFAVFLFLPMFALVISPTFIAMAEEFELPVPEAMQAFQSYLFGRELLIGLMAAAVYMGLAIATGFVLIVRFFPGLFSHRPLRWMAGSYYRLGALSVLSRTVEHERDFIAACITAANITPDFWEAKRLRRVAEIANAGQTPVRALYHSGLLSRDQSIRFGENPHARDVVWGLGQIAQDQVQRAIARISILLQILLVITVLLAAAFVGFVAWLLIQFLTDVIHRVLS